MEGLREIIKEEKNNVIEFRCIGGKLVLKNNADSNIYEIIKKYGIIKELSTIIIEYMSCIYKFNIKLKSYLPQGGFRQFASAEQSGLPKNEFRILGKAGQPENSQEGLFGFITIENEYLKWYVTNGIDDTGCLKTGNNIIHLETILDDELFKSESTGDTDNVAINILEHILETNELSTISLKHTDFNYKRIDYKDQKIIDKITESIIPYNINDYNIIKEKYRTAYSYFLIKKDEEYMDMIRATYQLIIELIKLNTN